MTLEVSKIEKTQKDKVEEIIKKLEDGLGELFESEKYQKYLDTVAKFHKYSSKNSMLIAMQKPDATCVAGYTSWQRDFKRYVKKGEKGIRILAPAPYQITKKVDMIDPATNKPVLGIDGKVVKEQIKVTVPAYKVTTVFDISQTEGKELPDIMSHLDSSVKDFKKFMVALKEISPVEIRFCEISGTTNGYYHLEKKQIAIQRGMSELQTIKTAIHEISHAKLHDCKNGLEKAADRRTKEIEAESIAYVVCQNYKLDTSDYSFGYIAKWSSDKNLDELKSSINTIYYTASEIIAQIDEKLKELSLKEDERETYKLAADIYALCKKCGYIDTEKSKESWIQMLTVDLKKGNVGYICKWMNSISATAESKEVYDKAEGIRKNLENVIEKNAVKSVAEKTDTYKQNKIDGDVKHHTRRH